MNAAWPCASPVTATSGIKNDRDKSTTLLRTNQHALSLRALRQVATVRTGRTGKRGAALMNIRVNPHAGYGFITGTQCSSDETSDINAALYFMS